VLTAANVTSGVNGTSDEERSIYCVSREVTSISHASLPIQTKTRRSPSLSDTTSPPEMIPENSGFHYCPDAEDYKTEDDLFQIHYLEVTPNPPIM
jgi:hypothetical protein